MPLRIALHGGGFMYNLTNYQRCILLVALQRGTIDIDPQGQDILIERLSAQSPWTPFPSLQAWEDYQSNH